MNAADADGGCRPYLDHNATTPMPPAVREAIVAHLGVYGNPSSRHSPGLEAAQALQRAREQIAAFFGAVPQEVVFTGSGSEAINLALKSTAALHAGRPCHIITSRIEHAATLETCRYLERTGVAVTYVPVNANGWISPDDVHKSLRPHTCLIAVMHANNETGVVQPVDEIAAVAQRAGVPIFCDAVQTAGKIPIPFGKPSVRMVAVSAHKLYGPKGVGALLVRGDCALSPLVHGGGQESGRRAGTENLLGIVGFAAACAEAARIGDGELGRQRELRERLLRGLQTVKGMRVNGDLERGLPGTLNVSFEGVRGDALVLALALDGIAVSAGSACHELEARPSHVLEAMGVPKRWLFGAVRFSLGRSNTAREIDHTTAAVVRVVRRLRSMAPGHLRAVGTVGG